MKNYWTANANQAVGNRLPLQLPRPISARPYRARLMRIQADTDQWADRVISNIVVDTENAPRARARAARRAPVTQHRPLRRGATVATANGPNDELRNVLFTSQQNIIHHLREPTSKYCFSEFRILRLVP